MKHERIRSDHDTNLLRIIACFFVVVIHASYPDGAQAYFFRALGAFSVPVFMMISGYYMLRRQPDPGKLLKKCGRLFLLLLFWSAFYYLYEVITGARSYGGVWALICYLLTEPAHLWYLYAAIALYALTPVLFVFCRAATRQEYRYALVLSFLLGSVLFTALRAGGFPVLETVAEKMKLNDMCGSVFCYLFGGYLQRWGVKRQRFFYILGGAGTLLTVLGTFFAGRSTTGDPLFARRACGRHGRLYRCSSFLFPPCASRCAQPPPDSGAGRLYAGDLSNASGGHSGAAKYRCNRRASGHFDPAAGFGGFYFLRSGCLAAEKNSVFEMAGFLKQEFLKSACAAAWADFW